MLANAVRPGDGAVDAAGNSPGVFTHGLDAARWQQVWDQLLADGFDSSVPAATKGDALIAVRAFVDTNGAGHAAYQPVAGDWYALEGPGGAGAQHFARYFSWEDVARSDTGECKNRKFQAKHLPLLKRILRFSFEQGFQICSQILMTTLLTFLMT